MHEMYMSVYVLNFHFKHRFPAIYIKSFNLGYTISFIICAKHNCVKIILLLHF